MTSKTPERPLESQRGKCALVHTVSPWAIRIQECRGTYL